MSDGGGLALDLLILAGCALWFKDSIATAVAAYRLPVFERLAPPPAEPGAGAAAQPAGRVSVVIAARNEEHAIERCARSLLAQTGLDLELILVDDRSEDRTRSIMERLAAEDRRVRVVHVESLPPGWIGKVHALKRGVDHASGSWLLFTDADVHFGADVLLRSLELCLRSDVEVFTLIPRMRHSRPIAGVLISEFLRELLTAIGIRQRGGIGLHGILGMGAFKLLRREVWERTPGFDAMKMDVLDDVTMSLFAVTSGGGKQGFAVSCELLQLDWYDSLSEVVHGFRKNYFPMLAGFDFRRALFYVAATALVWLAPFFGLARAAPLVRAVSAAALAAALAAGFYLIRIGLRRHLFSALVAPLVRFFPAYLLADSALAYWRQQGARWRETFYPMAELRQAFLDAREKARTWRSDRAGGTGLPEPRE